MTPKTFIFYLREPPLTLKETVDAFDVYYRMKDLAKADQESFWVIGFNAAQREIYNECLFIGGTNAIWILGFYLRGFLWQVLPVLLLCIIIQVGIVNLLQMM